MKKLATLLEEVKDLAAEEKAGWAWLKADKDVIKLLVDHPDLDNDAHKAVGEGTPFKEEQVRLLWRLAAVAAAFLQGGRANAEGFGRADSNPEQHRLGLEVEKEHVCPKARMDIQALIRGRISLDHEAEQDDYYYQGSDGEAKVKGEK